MEYVTVVRMALWNVLFVSTHIVQANSPPIKGEIVGGAHGLRPFVFSALSLLPGTLMTTTVRYNRKRRQIPDHYKTHHFLFSSSWFSLGFFIFREYF